MEQIDFPSSCAETVPPSLTHASASAGLEIGVTANPVTFDLEEGSVELVMDAASTETDAIVAAKHIAAPPSAVKNMRVFIIFSGIAVSSPRSGARWQATASIRKGAQSREQ